MILELNMIKNPEIYTKTGIITIGSKVKYLLDGRIGFVEELLQDGDACVKFTSGYTKYVKWNHLELLK